MIHLIDGDTKVCRVCKEDKLLKEFHPNKSCKQGVTGTCRKCSYTRLRSWYADNRKVRQNAANSRNKRRKSEVVLRFGNKCNDCQLTYPLCVYQFHHLDPTKKDVNPSYAMMNNPEKMWEELNKCVMLCANCHMIRHFGKEGVDGSTH